MSHEDSAAAGIDLGLRDRIDREIARQLLTAALESGGDYADLYFEYRTTGSLVTEEGRVKSAGRGVVQGVGVRVLRGEATGYAYSESLDVDDMRRAARLAGQIASGGGGREVDALQALDIPDLYPVAEPVSTAPGPVRLDLVRRADRAAQAYDARVQKVEVTLVDELREVLIATSDGRVVRDLRPMVRMNVRAIAEEGALRQVGIGGGGGRMGLDYFTRVTPESLGEEAARLAVEMLDARDAPAGEMTVVLGPGDSGVLLHEAVGHGLEADFNRKGTSNYSGRVGQMVASPQCTVVDDGTIVSSRGTINVDDEGHTPKRNVLIEDGKLVGYMHDRISSGHYELQASGNGRRQSFRHIPMPRMTNTYMLAGEHDPGEIIRSVKKGIYAKSFGGGQVNIANGDFVFGVTEGWLIEDGEITAPLKGTQLIGNGPDVLTKVDMVGNDFTLSDGRWTCGKGGQSVPVGVGTPTVRVAAITVGGTAI